MHIPRGTPAVSGAGLLVGLLLAAGCGARKPAAAAPMPPPEVAVVTVQPERAAITAEFPGRVSAFLVAEVRPQVSGIVKDRLFTEGSDVKAGDVLYQIDPALFQAACDSAAANLAVTQKAADRARAALGAGLAAIKRQQATLDLARTNRQRFEALVKEGAVAVSQCDQAVTEANVAEATLSAVEAQLESDRAAVAAAEAAIQQATAAQETARINLGYTRIVAPISGRIGKSSVTIGALATAYQPVPFTTIQQLDPVYVDAPQSSASLLRLKQSLPTESARNDAAAAKVALLLEDSTAYPQEGALRFADVTVDPSTGSFSLRMVFPNPNGMLLPGMFVRAVVNEQTQEQAILVPLQAVARDPRGSPLALVVNAGGQIEQRALTLDRTLGGRWLVTSGLAAGDRVVAEGMQKVRPGMTVKQVPFADVQPPAAAPAKPAATAN